MVKQLIMYPHLLLVILLQRIYGRILVKYLVILALIFLIISNYRRKEVNIMKWTDICLEKTPTLMEAKIIKCNQIIKLI